MQYNCVATDHVMKPQSNHIMHRFSFFDGLASVFGLADSRIEQLRKKFSERTDAEALRGDWIAVGQDMSRAFKKVREKENHR